MTNFPNERIAECKARCEAATQADVKLFIGAERGEDDMYECEVYGASGDIGVATFYARRDEDFGFMSAAEVRANAVLFINAVTDLPDALDALAEARRERDEAEALLLRFRSDIETNNFLRKRGLLEATDDRQ